MKILSILTLVLVSCGQTIKLDEIQKNNSKYENQINISGNIDAARELISNSEFSLKSSNTENVELSIHSLKLEGAGDINKLIKELENLSSIKFAEKNYEVTINNIPKDKLWLSQWALSNVGQDSPRGSQGEIGSDLGALKAWQITKGSKEIVVGVIDTGIDYNHKDLKENMWINEAEKNGIKGVDDDNNGYTDDIYGWDFITANRDKMYHGRPGDPDPIDDNNHGTHCAGIIGAKPNNFEGVAGINWNVSLMALKFLDANGSGSSKDAFNAIVYGADNGAHILSNSWGGGESSRLVKEAIEYAKKKGVIFIAAAGNDGKNNDEKASFPAGYDVDTVLSVAASDNKDRLASFSNYGPLKVHVAAPGVDIMSSIVSGLKGNNGEMYASFSGTSMATPYAAGVAALILANDPSLIGNPLELKRVLMDSVDIKPSMNGRVMSGGRINAFRALNKTFNTVENKNISRKEINVSSPSFHNEVMDKTWSFHEKGASKVRLNFSKIIIDHGFDIAAIYDRDYNLIYKFDGDYSFAFTSPWITGDTIRIRFANSLVKIVDHSINKTTAPFANFDSEGITIDSFEFIK